MDESGPLDGFVQFGATDLVQDEPADFAVGYVFVDDDRCNGVEQSDRVVGCDRIVLEDGCVFVS